MDFKEKLKARAEKEGISLTPKQLGQFELFYKMLIETNKSMNLTAITDEDEVIEKHFIDSLSCRRVVDMSQIRTCIDVGTGAGFPGIPLKIFCPSLKVVLIDSLAKRLNFLQNVIEALQLQDIECVHLRAEDAGKNAAHREKYDIVTARAVARLSVLAEYCLPLVKTGGMFIALKGSKYKEEINDAAEALNILGGKLVSARQVELPGLDDGRAGVALKKVKPSPKAYPRKAGLPEKHPLE